MNGQAAHAPGTTVRRPASLYLICLPLAAACVCAAVLFSDWPWMAIPLALVAGASIGAFQGMDRARIGVVAGLLGVVALIAYGIHGVWTQPDFAALTNEVRWRGSWPWALLALALLVAGLYLYRGRAPRRFFGDGTRGAALRITRSMGAVMVLVVAVSVFWYAAYPRLMGWPLGLEQAVELAASRMSPEQKATLAATPREGLSAYHLGLGMAIRNDFGLWGGNSRLLREACGGEACHPDIASSVIIDRLWLALQDDARE